MQPPSPNQERGGSSEPDPAARTPVCRLRFRGEEDVCRALATVIEAFRHRKPNQSLTDKLATFKNTISHKNSQHLSENRILWPPGPTVPMQAGTFPGPPAASARAPWTRGGDPVSGACSRSGAQTPGREPRALLHGGSVCALPWPVSMTLCLGPHAGPGPLALPPSGRRRSSPPAPFATAPVPKKAPQASSSQFEPH